jgi:hypothetical protein
VKVRRRFFDVQMLVLASPALGRNHSAAVDLVKVAVGKLVSASGSLAFLVIAPDEWNFVFREGMTSVML